MGPSGSGKSTLVDALAGLDGIDSGRVLIGDTDLTSLSERDRTLLRRERLGFVFQAFDLVPALTAEENIALPSTRSCATFRWGVEVDDTNANGPPPLGRNPPTRGRSRLDTPRPTRRGSPG